jgi:hypothetical protein
MNGARWALLFLPAKRTAKNSAVKSIELLSKLEFYCLYSARHYLQAEKPTHSQAHFIFLVPQKIKRACLFPLPQSEK